MKFKLSIVFLLAAMALSACAIAPALPTPAPTAAPTATAAATTTSAPAAAANSKEYKCGPGACVRQVIVQNDGTRLIFFFDLVDRGGKLNESNPPQFVGNLIFGSYYIKSDGNEDFLMGGELSTDKYFCYSGSDLPWTGGNFGAVCGFGIPLNDMQTYKPQVGEKVRVTLPFYSNFNQTVTVVQGEPEVPNDTPTPGGPPVPAASATPGGEALNITETP